MCERHDCTFSSCFNIDFSPWSRTDNSTGQETNSALRWHFVGCCHEVLHLPVLNAQSMPSFTWALEMRSYMAQSDELVDSTSSVQQGISVWISQETLDMEKGLPWRKGPGRVGWQYGGVWDKSHTCESFQPKLRFLSLEHFPRWHLDSKCVTRQLERALRPHRL